MSDLQDLLDSWVISLKAEHKSPNTVRAYATAVRLYISAGHENLDKHSVREWLASIAHPTTANLKARAIKRFSAWLAEEGETDGDVLLGMKAPAPADAEVPKLTNDEVRALIAACGNDFRGRRDAALIQFGLETGCRAEEVLSLRLDDLDMTRQTAYVRRGKGGKPRIVPFGPGAAQRLDRYLRARRKHPRSGSPWLWVSDKSEHLSYQGMQSALYARARQAGVRHFHYHRLRHTMASSWLHAGGTEGGLMTIAGWKSRDMIDRYVKDAAVENALAEARRLNLGLCRSAPVS